MQAWNLPKSLVCWFISIMKVFHEGVYKTLLTWMYNQIESERKENWANQFSIPEKVCHIVPKKSEIQYTHPNVHRVKYCKGKEWKKDLKLGVFAYDNFSPTFHSWDCKYQKWHSEYLLRFLFYKFKTAVYHGIFMR